MPYRKAIDRELLSELVSRLEAHKTDLPLDHAVPFVAALLAFGDRLRPELIAFGTDTETHIRRVVRWYLMQEADSEARTNTFIAAAEDAQAVLIPLAMCFAESERIRKREGTGDAVLADTRVADAISRCRRVAEQAATSGALKRHPRLARALWFLRQFDEKGVRKWVRELIESPEGTLSVLRTLVQKSHSHTAGDSIGRLHVRVFLQEIEGLCSIDEFHAAVTSARARELDPVEREALAAYERAMDRRARGLDDTMRVDDEDAVE